jgi:hypothetical protein
MSGPRDLEAGGTEADGLSSSARKAVTDSDGTLHVMMPDIDPKAQLCMALGENGFKYINRATEQACSEAADALTTSPASDAASGLRSDPLEDVKRVVYYPNAQGLADRRSRVEVGQRLLATDLMKAGPDSSLASSLLANTTAREVPLVIMTCDQAATSKSDSGLRGP